MSTGVETGGAGRGAFLGVGRVSGSELGLAGAPRPETIGGGLGLDVDFLDMDGFERPTS